MSKRLLVISAITAVVGLTVGAVAFAGPQSPSKASVLPSSSCGPVFYKGSGSPQYLIATDLPLQGAGRAQNLAMGQAVRFVLEKQYKFKAGKYSIGFQECDDSTARCGSDPRSCSPSSASRQHHRARGSGSGRSASSSPS